MEYNLIWVFNGGREIFLIEEQGNANEVKQELSQCRLFFKSNSADKCEGGGGGGCVDIRTAFLYSICVHNINFRCTFKVEEIQKLGNIVKWRNAF